MAISIKCSGCDGLLEVGNEYAGKPVRCKRCQTVLTVQPSRLPPEIDVVANEPVAQEASLVVTGRPTTSAPPPRRPRNWDDDPRHESPRRRTPEARSSSAAVLIVVLSVVAVLGICIVCGGTGGVAWLLLAPQQRAAQPAAPPIAFKGGPIAKQGDGPMKGPPKREIDVPPIGKEPVPPVDKGLAQPPIGKEPVPPVNKGPANPDDESMEALRQGKFTKPTEAAAPTSYLRVISTGGDYIGQGKRYAYLGNQLQLRTQFGGCVQTSVEGWRIEFAPPRGENLQAAEYLGARRYPFNDNAPGISFSGDGRGCNTIAGQFRVWEIEVQGDNVVRLAVDFVQHCEEKGPPLYGMLRYNSKFQ